MNNGTLKLVIWVVGLLFTISLAVTSVNFAEVRRLEHEKVSIREIDQLCLRIGRLETSINNRLDRLETKIDRQTASNESRPSESWGVSP